MTEHRIMSEAEKLELHKTYDHSGGYKKKDAELQIHMKNIGNARKFIDHSFSSTPETTALANSLSTVNKKLRLYRRETVRQGTENEREMFFRGFKYWYDEVMQIENKSYETVMAEFMKDFDIDKELEKIKNGGFKQ